MSNTTFVHIPFNSGQSDAVSRKMMPDGMFRRVINGDLDAAGALTIRQGFSPLTMLSYKGAMQAFDLYSVDESLVALGADVRSVPHDLFVYTNDVPANPWRGMNHPQQFASVLAATEVQRIGGDPYRAALILHTSVAANTTGLVATSSTALVAGNAETTIHVFDPNTDETFYLTTRGNTTSPNPRAVIAMGANFGLLEATSTQSLALRTLATNSAPSGSSFGTLTATILTDIEFAFGFAVKTDATNIHILYHRITDDAVVYAKFSFTGTQSGSSKVIAATSNGNFALDINATQVVALVGTSTTGATLTSFGINSPFTTATGPTAVFAGFTLSTVSVAFGRNNDRVCVAQNGSLMEFEARDSSHSLMLGRHYTAFTLMGDVAQSGDHSIVPVIHGWTEDITGGGTMAILDLGRFGSVVQTDGLSHSIAWYEDRNIARTGLNSAGGNFGGNVVIANGWTYVQQGFRDLNGSHTLMTRRAKFSSTARRSGVSLGGLFYLAGGQVMVSDQVQPVESGMPPPKFVGAAVKGTTGSLTQLGVYKYRAVAEWLDRKGNLHLSPVASERTVTLTGAEDDVTWTLTAPPSLRLGTQGGATSTGVKVSLYRTETNQELFPAEAAATVHPAATSPGFLSGLGAAWTAVVNGGAPQVISFTAAAIDAQSISTQILAQVTGITIEVTGPLTFVIRTVTTGPAASFQMSTGSFLGLGTAPFFGTATAEAGEIFYMTASAIVPAATELGGTVSILDTTADSALISNRQLYTTGDRGALSGVLDFAPPLPATFLAATRDRLWTAGSNELVQASQRAFPNEAIAFAEVNLVGPVGFAYQARVSGRITGIAALDERLIIGTRDKLYVTGGEGPNYVGQGEFEVPIELPSEVGFYDFRSIVLTSEGLWFQGDVDKLYLLPRGGGVPTWAGMDVKDRLGGFISGAAVTEGQTPRVAFGVGDAARAMVRDVTAKQWFEYTLPAIPARTFIEHRGQFYFVDGSGTVWAPSAFSDNGAVIPLEVDFGDFAPFGPNGQGRLRMVQFLGEFKSAATVKLETSYDGGITFEDCGTHTVTGLSADSPVRLQWYPPTQRGDRYTFRLTMTPSTTGQGVVFNAFTAAVVPSRGETKLGAAVRK